MVDLIRPKIYDASELVGLLGPGYVLALPTFNSAQELARLRQRRMLESIAAGVLAVIIPAITIVLTLKH